MARHGEHFLSVPLPGPDLTPEKADVCSRGTCYILAMIQITPSISIGENEIEEHFIRAGGPGGQKVNKTDSAVQLRFNARKSPAFSNAVFLRLKPLAGRRMTRDGVIVITANRFRTQESNRRDAMARLVDLISKAAVPPQRRRKTKPSRGVVKRRLTAKRQRGETKRRRSPVTDRDNG